MNKLCDLLLNQDESPKLIGKFSKNANRVTIEIMDERDACCLKLEDTVCFAIGNTMRWSWSIKGVRDGSFTYFMTSDLGEVFEGKFSRGGK